MRCNYTATEKILYLCYFSKIAKLIVNGLLGYPLKSDYHGYFLKYPATANPMSYLNNFVELIKRNISAFGLPLRQVALLCYSCGRETNGVKKVSDILETFLDHAPDGVKRHRIKPTGLGYVPSNKDCTLSSLGYKILLKGTVKGRPLSSIFRQKSTSARKLICLCFRSHPRSVLCQRLAKNNQEIYHSSSMRCRYQASCRLSSLEESYHNDEDFGND